MIALHHLWQGSIALLVIIAIARSYRVNLNTFGFNTNGWRDTLRLVALFCLGWFVIQASIGVTFIVVSDLSTALPFPFTRTGSLLGPILAHNLLNGVIVTTGIGLWVLFG